jgi:hypothetical protein
MLGRVYFRVVFALEPASHVQACEKSLSVGDGVDGKANTEVGCRCLLEGIGFGAVGEE